MLRRIRYRSAATTFVFCGLWFVLGLMMLASPIPHALGIGGAMFVAWFFVFLLGLAASGGALTVAAVNRLLPPTEGPGSGARRPLPAPPATAPSGREREPVAPGTATHDAEGRPLPWTSSPLPERRPRRPAPRIDPRQGR